MVIVIDANILIQCIINIKGSVAALILENSSRIDFIVPEFVATEISRKETKIYSSSTLKKPAFRKNFDLLLGNLTVIKDDEIPETIFKKAYEIVRDIDPNDVVYIALAIASDALLWSDDYKLLRGLRKKGVNSIINTKEFKEILKGL